MLEATSSVRLRHGGSVKTRKFIHRAMVLLAMLGFARGARADSIVAVNGGSGAPPLTLGGYTMTPFGTDSTNPTGSFTITSVAAPTGGFITFNVAQQHFHGISFGNGYSGDSYLSPTGAEDLIITLPANTGAFYFDALPNQQTILSVTATAQNGTTLIESIDGVSGSLAPGNFGFYGTGNALISSIHITASSELLVGEFGIAAGASQAVPLPSTFWGGALLLAGLGLVHWRRSHLRSI
jgi:hypothetical protein